MESIVAAQRRWFWQGKTLSPAARRKALDRLEAGLRARENQVYSALRKDLNKHPFEAYETELGIVFSELRYAKAHLSQWMKPQDRKSTRLNSSH